MNRSIDFQTEINKYLGIQDGHVNRRSDNILLKDSSRTGRHITGVVISVTIASHNVPVGFIRLTPPVSSVLHYVFYEDTTENGVVTCASKRIRY